MLFYPYTLFYYFNAKFENLTRLGVHSKVFWQSYCNVSLELSRPVNTACVTDFPKQSNTAGLQWTLADDIQFIVDIVSCSCWLITVKTFKAAFWLDCIKRFEVCLQKMDLKSRSKIQNWTSLRQGGWWSYHYTTRSTRCYRKCTYLSCMFACFCVTCHTHPLSLLSFCHLP